MPGTLFVVATPIGNLEDITLRALRVLREADLIAAEDTRRTARLLARHSISTSMISFHEHNTRRVVPQLLSRLQSGKNRCPRFGRRNAWYFRPWGRVGQACIEPGFRSIRYQG
jgi:16S rRNA (cytidine1402-2'-O)-methyltransferase